MSREQLIAIIIKLFVSKLILENVTQFGGFALKNCKNCECSKLVRGTLLSNLYDL